MGHLLIRQVPADGDVSMLTDAEEKLLFRFQIHEFAARPIRCHGYDSSLISYDSYVMSHE